MSRPPLPRDAEGNIIREKIVVNDPVIIRPDEVLKNGFIGKIIEITTDDLPSPYTITLTMGKDIYSAVAPTIFEALSKIAPTSFISMATLSVEHNGKEKEIPLRLIPIRLKRIFSKEWELRLFAKRIGTLL